jgi:fatty acid desaturase
MEAMTRQHALINGWMLTESALLHWLFAALALHGLHSGQTAWLVAGIVLQGVWLQRTYCVGHEASHKKLFASVPWLNDVIGQAFLFLILVPLPVFRAIHRFHHGANRRDAHTSALEVHVVPPGASPIKQALPWVLWYLAVFAGGWFIHGLISVMLFVFCPPAVARKISPAFSGWTWSLQIRSIVLFVLPVLGHVALATWGGAQLWWALLGGPLAVFAWVYSVQLYVYHYKTTIGPETRFHARRLHGGPLLGWWLLNLNEHDTHHRRTKVVWYALPEQGRPLPEPFAANQNVHRFSQGLLQQLKGPLILEKE